VTRAQIIVHETFTNKIHALTTQLYSCAEAHAAARQARSSLVLLHVVRVCSGVPRERVHGIHGLLLEAAIGALGRGAPPSSPPRSTAVATEVAGTPAARFLPLPFSSLSQLVQPLNKGFIKKLVAVTSPNSNVALEGSIIRQMALRTPPRKGSRISPPGRPGPHAQASGRQPTRWPRPRCICAVCP
jgi:hypothetical protein